MDPNSRLFLQLARFESEHSPDPSKKIGAIFAKGSDFLASGSNRPPEKLSILHQNSLGDNYEKDKFIVHAEQNAICSASRTGVELCGSTLYVYGLPPCNPCALSAIQAGISKVVIQQPREYDGRWKESCDQALQNFKDCGVEVERYDFDFNPL